MSGTSEGPEENHEPGSIGVQWSLLMYPLALLLELFYVYIKHGFSLWHRCYGILHSTQRILIISCLWSDNVNNGWESTKRPYLMAYCVRNKRGVESQ